MLSTAGTAINGAINVCSKGDSLASCDSQFTWLALYFCLNLLLTLYNKSVLTSFPFPYTLTALHALCSALGGMTLRWRRVYIPKSLSHRHELVLAMFSTLYAVNIAVSNASLHLVTVPVSIGHPLALEP